TTQLNHERVALAPAGQTDRHLHAVRRWARETGADRQEWVRVLLARVHAKVEALKLMNWRVASALGSGDLNPADASALKVFGTELRVESLRMILEVVCTDAFALCEVMARAY